LKGEEGTVLIRLYATLRQHAGTREVEVTVEDGQSVGDVLQVLVQRYPKLNAEIWNVDGSLASHVAVILKGRNIRHLAGVDTPIADDDQLFVFPPVGGGMDLTGLTLVNLKFASHFRARLGQSRTAFSFKGNTLREFIPAVLQTFDIADLLLDNGEVKPNVRVVINGRYSYLVGGWDAVIPDGAIVVFMYAYGLTY
jgi:molybdopterin synthase sulfur carrier subunit